MSENDQAELDAALEELFNEPMVKLGREVYASAEHLPEPLKDDLDEALGTKEPVQKPEQEQGHDYS